MLLAVAPFPPQESLAAFILIATVLGYGFNKWGVAEGAALESVPAM